MCSFYYKAIRIIHGVHALLELQDFFLSIVKGISYIVRLENGAFAFRFRQPRLCARQLLCICHIGIHFSTKCSSGFFYLAKRKKAAKLSKECFRFKKKQSNLD